MGGPPHRKRGHIDILRLKPEFDSITPQDEMIKKANEEAAETVLNRAYPNTEPTPLLLTF
jgi:hypothetical protein